MFAIAQVAVLVKIILTVVILDPRSFDTFTLPKSVAAHSLTLVIAALLLWLIARHGLGLLSWSPLHLGVAAVLLAFAVATPFSLDPTVALFGVFKRYLGLTQMLDNVLLYAAVTILFRDLRSLRLLAGVSIGVALPVLAYAFVQRLGHDPLSFVQAPTTIPISTLGNPDLVGGFMSIVGITALAFAALLAGRPITWYRVSLVVIGAASVGILYVTGVRSGLLGLAAGWAGALAIAFVSRTIGRRRRLAMAGVVVVLGLGILVSPFRERLASVLVGNDQAVANRLEIWSVALAALQDRPLFGLGPDNFAAFYPAHRHEASIITGNLENSTHDMWLYIGTSAGLIGVLAMALLVAIALWKGIALARRGSPSALALVPLLAYLGQALVNVNEIVLEWPFWVSLGVIAAGMTGPAALRRPTKANARRAAFVGVVALAGALLVVAFGVLPRILSGEAMLAAEAYSTAGHGRTGVINGERAVTMDPRRAEAWSVEGSALFRARDATAAVSAFAAAAQRQPWHPLPWTNLALSWSTIGNSDAAYEAAQRATIADPYDGTARELLATLAYDRGDYARAAAEGDRAIAYELPAGESAYFITVSAYAHLKQLDRAESLAREGIQRAPSIRLRVEYAAILGDLGQKDEALSVVNGVLAEQPDNTDAKALKTALSAQ